MGSKTRNRYGRVRRGVGLEISLSVVRLNEYVKELKDKTILKDYTLNVGRCPIGLYSSTLVPYILPDKKHMFCMVTVSL